MNLLERVRSIDRSGAVAESEKATRVAITAEGGQLRHPCAAGNTYHEPGQALSSQLLRRLSLVRNIRK